MAIALITTWGDAMLKQCNVYNIMYVLDVIGA